MYNKKALNVDLGKFTKSNPHKNDIIVDPMGQWKYPGQNTRIPGSDITMQGVNYPVWAQPNIGPGMMMQPGQDYNFPNADYVDEFPQMQKDGDYIEADLTPEEIDEYRNGGYIVEECEECNELPTASKGEEIKPRTLSERKPKTTNAAMLMDQRVSQINSSWEDNRALDEARRAYTQEEERVKQAVKNMLRLAENKDLNNTPTRESLSYIDHGRYFCSTHSCELARDAGFDKIDGTKHKVIPGNASAASYYKDPNSGYQFINSAKDSLPGDVVQIVDPQTGDYQGNTFAERDFPNHSMINKGRSINDDGNVYYNAIGGSRDNYGKTTYDLKDSRHWGWRYVGDTPKRKQDFLDAQKRSLGNRLQGLPFRELSNIESNIDKSIDTTRMDSYNQKVADIKNSGKSKRDIKKELESFHFKNGGYIVDELPQAQNGRNVRYTDNPNDPGIKAYADSSAAFNFARSYEDTYNPNNTTAHINTRRLSAQDDERLMPFYSEFPVSSGTKFTYEIKKPVQPVKYRDTEVGKLPTKKLPQIERPEIIPSNYNYTPQKPETIRTASRSQTVMEPDSNREGKFRVKELRQVPYSAHFPGEGWEDMNAPRVMYYNPTTREETTERFQQGGYIELELDDSEIELYKKGGYIVEKLPQAQKGIEVTAQANVPTQQQRWDATMDWYNTNPYAEMPAWNKLAPADITQGPMLTKEGVLDIPYGGKWNPIDPENPDKAHYELIQQPEDYIGLPIYRVNGKPMSVDPDFNKQFLKTYSKGTRGTPEYYHIYGQGLPYNPELKSTYDMRYPNLNQKQKGGPIVNKSTDEVETFAYAKAADKELWKNLMDKTKAIMNTSEGKKLWKQEIKPKNFSIKELQRFTEGVKEFNQEAQNYERARRKVKEKKISTSDFERMYKEKDWSKFDKNVKTENYKGEYQDAVNKSNVEKEKNMWLTDAVMEFTGAPSLQRIAQDPIGAAKGVGQTIADVASLPQGLATGAYNYATDGNFNMGQNIIGQNYGEGLDETLDVLGVLPGIGAASKLAKFTKPGQLIGDTGKYLTKKLPGSPVASSVDDVGKGLTQQPIYRGVYINDEIRNLPKFKGKTDDEILDIMGTTIPGDTGTLRKKQLNQTLNFGRDYDSALEHIGKFTDEGAIAKLGNTKDFSSGQMYILKVQPDDLPFISAEKQSKLYKQHIADWKKNNPDAGFILGDDAKNINPKLLKEFGESAAFKTEGTNVISGNFPQYIGAENSKIGKLLESKKISRQDYLDYLENFRKNNPSKPFPINKDIFKTTSSVDDVGKASINSSLKAVSDRLTKASQGSRSVAGEILGELKQGKANRESIKKGNEWLENWIKHPTTQSKIDASIDDKKYFATTFLKDPKEAEELFELIRTQSKNFKPDSKEFSLLKQFDDNLQQYISKQNRGSIHSDNWGVSYKHSKSPEYRQSAEMGTLPYGDERYGSWISRTSKLPQRKRISTTIHEGTHDWVSREAFEKSGMRNTTLKNTNPELKKDFFEWEEHRKYGRDPVKEMGRERAHNAYLADPTEVHARIMELRKALGADPDYIMESGTAKDIIDWIEKGGSPISPMFVDVIDKDPKKLAELFNKLWAIPAAIGTGAALQNDTPQYPDGGPIKMQNGGNESNFQKGGEFIEMELTPAQIRKYRKNGYIIEDI